MHPLPHTTNTPSPSPRTLSWAWGSLWQGESTRREQGMGTWPLTPSGSTRTLTQPVPGAEENQSPSSTPSSPAPPDHELETSCWKMSPPSSMAPHFGLNSTSYEPWASTSPTRKPAFHRTWPLLVSHTPPYPPVPNLRSRLPPVRTFIFAARVCLYILYVYLSLQETGQLAQVKPSLCNISCFWIK